MTLPTSTVTLTLTGSISLSQSATVSLSPSSTRSISSTLTLPTGSATSTLTLPTSTATRSIPTESESITLPTRTSTRTRGNGVPPQNTNGPSVSPSALFSTTTECPVDGHWRRLEDKGTAGAGNGTEVRRFYLPGQNPGRLAQVNCVSAIIRETSGSCQWTPTIRVRLVYGLPGAEPDNFCSGDDCESIAPTHKGACIRARKGSEDKAEMKNGDTCVQIGDRDQSFNPEKKVSTATSWFEFDPKVDTTPVSTISMGDGDLIPSHDLHLVGAAPPLPGMQPAMIGGVRNGPAFFFKNHGCGLAHFFLEYHVNASEGCMWIPEVSFSGVVSRPESGYCFKTEDTDLGFRGAGNDNRVSGKWWSRENKTESDFNFDFDASSMAAMPRSANLKFEVDNVMVSSGNSYTWMIGDGPTVDVDCVHIHSTAAVWDQLAHSITYDHNGYVNFRCYDSLFGHNGVPNLSPEWKNEYDEHHMASTRQEVYGLHLIETLQCSGATDPKMAGDISAYLKTARITNEGYDVNKWSTCCEQNTADSCEGLTNGGVSQCVWVNKNYEDTKGSCLPAVTSTAVDLKRQVGINKTFSYLSSVASMPLSAYILQRNLNNEFLYGLGRQWVLKFTNNYGTKAQPCTQCVTIGFKSNVHGGVCEPAGREYCENRMDRCVVTPRENWPKFWALENGASNWATLSSADNDRYRICNCLKEKENCYRNVGCTSTKKYQLILQNCYDVGCGNTCIRDY